VEEAISALEQKVDQMMVMCDRLRAENHELRAQLAGAEREKSRLAERMSVARSRLEMLMHRLPA